MSLSLITLTTDFGLGSPYVAAMKGAVLSVNSDVQLLDLTHCLPPQDLRACSFFLRAALPYFPLGTLHVIVVDPGVGSERDLLYVETCGQRLLVPDNGCWTELARTSQAVPKVIRLSERRYWREHVSSTFHGRDILAPVAGHLSKGLDPLQIGSPVSSWVQLFLPMPRVTDDIVEAEVLFVDDFGNLITSLAADDYGNYQGRIKDVLVAGQIVNVCQVRTYTDAAGGTLVMLVSSGGTLEIAEVNGNAARRLGASAGAAVKLVLS